MLVMYRLWLVQYLITERLIIHSVQYLICSPSKRSKSAAVRSVDSNMTRHNELMSNRNKLIHDLWRIREETEEAARTEHRTRVQKVYKLAADLGVSAETTPQLFHGVMHIVESDALMELFFIATPAERRFMMENYSRVNN